MEKFLLNEIFVLSDGRPGNDSQTIGLAKKISEKTEFPYKIINISFDFLLPNFLRKASLIGVSPDIKKKLREIKTFPKLIISAGRRLSPIALYLKKKSGGISKVIQIMNPELSFDKFDFVILPKHDFCKHSSFQATKNNSKIIQIIGSLNQINQCSTEKEAKKFSSKFAKITKIKIVVFIGGDTKNTKFNTDSALILADRLAEVAKKNNAILLISNSRRTSDKLTNTIKSRLKENECEFEFFYYKDFAGSDDNNPYFALIFYADFFVITGDSVSMISECCSTGKQVFIFDENKISSKKHTSFHQNLFDENYAKKFSSGDILFDNHTPILSQSRFCKKLKFEEKDRFHDILTEKKLEETKRAADIILQFLIP
jgi:mitochondrial fission protein ELM1